MMMNMNYGGGIQPGGQGMSQMSYYNQPQSGVKAIPDVNNILFVADLPDECCEEDLSNFFKSYNFIFAKVIHNVMRTHAFVHFNTVDDAERARAELNGVKISAKYSSNKMSKPVRLCKYETRQSSHSDMDDKCNLLVKNIAKDVSAHAFFNMFRQFGDVRSCKLVVDYVGNSKGYGYVSYYHVDDSVKAKNQLNEKDLCGKLLKVSFLERGRTSENRKNNIYVKHIPKSNFDNDDLENLFKSFGEIKSAIVLKDQLGESKGFGFVCFSSPEDAEDAFKSMNNKNIWKDLPPLYVNFAMKKGERQEHLMKKREEMFKLAQKMTVFSKIKDENSVKTEKDFETQIRAYLRVVLSKEYDPKSIKVRIETKNAFITMNSQRDAEEFVRKFQDYSKENPTNLFFNLYKSKIERINANSYFKKYNQFQGAFSEPLAIPSQGMDRTYKMYNDFSSSTEFPFSTLSQDVPAKKQYVSYNNFQQPTEPLQLQKPVYQNYNQFNNFNNPSQATAPTQQLPQSEIRPILPSLLDAMDQDALGEVIYNMVEPIYPQEASKITGMLIELDVNQVKKLLSGKKEEIVNTINRAHTLLQTKK